VRLDPNTACSANWSAPTELEDAARDQVWLPPVISRLTGSIANAHFSVRAPESLVTVAEEPASLALGTAAFQVKASVLEAALLTDTDRLETMVMSMLMVAELEAPASWPDNSPARMLAASNIRRITFIP
jgi:hypothetical protein